MKKLLLSCVMVLGIGVNAQINFTGDFEESTNFGQYGQFGGGAIIAAGACSGVLGGQTQIGGAVPSSGWMLNLDVVETEFGQINNGQAATISFNYKKAAGLTGTLYVALMTQDPVSGSYNISYISSGAALGAAAITTCTSVSGSIPTGVMQPGIVYGVGAWFVRTGSTTGNIYIDDISMAQQNATNIPSCTAFTMPSNGGVVSGGTVGFTWNAEPNAVNYKLTVGTSAGGSNTFNETVGGTKQNILLLPNTTYYAKIVPGNTLGDASGCEEITFTTNSSIAYCGPLTSSVPNGIAPIKSFTFAGITNTSDTSATSLGSFQPSQDFTNVIFDVQDNVTSVPFSVTGVTTGNAGNRWATAVFIDWNNDGDFVDAGESYFNTPATILISAANSSANPAILTGNIAIPTGTAIGQKRMRVKYNFSAVTLNPALVSGCAEMINGQSEDYTINYIDHLAVGNVDKSNVSVYPNPFVDVVKISDIKGVISVNVVDASGKTVKRLAPAAELNLGQLKSGMYFINLQYEDGSVKTVKSIKK